MKDIKNGTSLKKRKNETKNRRKKQRINKGRIKINKENEQKRIIKKKTKNK